MLHYDLFSFYCASNTSSNIKLTLPLMAHALEWHISERQGKQ